MTPTVWFSLPPSLEAISLLNQERGERRVGEDREGRRDRGRREEGGREGGREEE